VPPDDFSATGQLWGNPTYRWERLAEEGYRWWTDRARAALCRADLVRLDHFRGFVAHWEVDASSATAATGRWMPGPGRSLFGACRAVLGRDLPFVAEDLGTIGPEVHELRQELGLPGMRVLQFAFDDNDDDSPHLPRNYPRDAVAYTGTHDNDTFRGWFDRLDPVLRQRVLVTLEAGERDVVRRAIDTLYASQARLVVVPLQDVLELGSEARMNRPGTIGGNWAWRASASELTLDRAARLRRSAEAAGRA
jgi:4-alpha-glucanotransferase